MKKAVRIVGIIISSLLMSQGVAAQGSHHVAYFKAHCKYVGEVVNEACLSNDMIVKNYQGFARLTLCPTMADQARRDCLKKVK
jgi:hypothetical protein